MKFGVDYYAAASQADIAALKQHGVEFVCRYLAPPGNVKNINAAEHAQLTRSGLALVSVWEANGDEPYHGQNQGVQDARLATAEAKQAGMPAGTPIYYALDRDPSNLTAAEWTAVEGYYRGAASVTSVKEVGAYGGLALIKRLFDKKLIGYGWQTYAWSGGQWDTRAHLRQYLNAQKIGGLNVDFDHALTTDYGQWMERDVRKPIKHYHMTYRNKKGQIQHTNTTAPILFQIRHKNLRKNGDVVQHPVR